MRVTVPGNGVWAILTALCLAGSAAAQAPPPPPVPTAPLPSPGFVPPYEIMRTVRAAGFDPLAPPLREGATYVLRATDFRGILMRVVVDARTGAIRDANRILAGPGNYGAAGQLGMTAPDDVSPDMMPQPYGPPPEFDLRETAPDLQQTPEPVVHPAPKRHAKRGATPPLPRARPAALAVRKPSDDAKPASASDRVPTLGSGAEVAIPVAPAARPGRAPPAAIND